VLLTRLPLVQKYPFDLHALDTPPAFILSQDQTLNKIFYPRSIKNLGISTLIKKGSVEFNIDEFPTTFKLLKVFIFNASCVKEKTATFFNITALSLIQEMSCFSKL
jgi:hypothetical protein